MKLSILITALIVVVATAFAWQNHQQLERMRARNAKLAEAAAALGKPIAADVSRNGSSSTRSHERENEEALAAEFIAFTNEVGRLLENGISPDAQTAKKSADFIDRIMTLNASQMETFLAQFRTAPGINEFTRKDVLMDCVMALSTKNPRAGLDILLKSPELLNEGSITKQYLGESLGNLAKDDPQSALEWIRSNKETHPDFITDEAMSFVVAGVATNETSLAFRLLSEIEQSNHSKAIAKIAEAATTPEQRSGTLAALRQFAAAQQNPQVLKDGISDLAFGGVHNKRGFDETVTWLASAQLSSEELASATQNMEHRVNPGDTAPWLEWISDSGLPADVVKDRAYNLAAEWTERDYQAAGNWLNSAPNSPEKSAAIGAYAAKAYPYDPEASIQWLSTLPQGPDLTRAVKNIYRSMPKDSDAAKAFASEYGLDPAGLSN